MKTRFLIAALLLMAFGSVKAQNKPIPTPDGDASKINTLVVNCVGSVYLQQGERLMLNDYGHSGVQYRVEDSVLYLEGVGTPRDVTIPNLTYLKVSGTAGVRSKGQLSGENLSINKMGTGELSLEVGYNNIYVHSTGTGDVILLGDCNVFCSEPKGLGKVNTNHLNYKVLVAKNGDQWNMAFNIDEDLNDPRRHFLNGLVNNAAPFFETESNRARESSANDKAGLEDIDRLHLDELMRELGENLEMLSDSVDWEQFERDMEKWGESMEEWGRKMEKWGERFEDKHSRDYDSPRGCYFSPAPDKNRRPEKKSLLLDANWNGFEAGLNMLIDPTMTYAYNNPNGTTGMEIRPLRSWYFGFNIADVGIAFNRRHTAGLFTGVGIGWNNFSWNNDVKIGYDSETDGYTVVPIESDQVVKNTKYGALFLQMPLMFEVRPTRHMYIDAGVTGGVRIAQWNRVKYDNGNSDKQFYGGIGSGVRLLKLDASLRVGGDDIGFFANYALLPLFKTSNAKVHPVSFGFSINF